MTNYTKSLDRSNFLYNIKKIGKKTHKKYISLLYENIKDEDIITICNHIESYWFDSFRSSLIWYCNDIVGGEPEKTIIPSVMMSIIGSGIGIHDDIIDKTKAKGLRNTVPNLFGLKKSLIIGDLLIIKGLTLTDLILDEFDKETANSLINVFKEFYLKLAEGEMLEINANKSLNIDLETYHAMLWKLGIDGEACAKIGAISGNATKSQMNALSYFGGSMGYINRLVEELNDMLSTENNLIMRIKNESLPLALLYASKKSLIYYKTINELIKKDLNKYDLDQLIKICYNVNAFDYIKENIKKNYYKTKTMLDIFPDTYSKSMLIKSLDHITKKQML